MQLKENQFSYLLAEQWMITKKSGENETGVKYNHKVVTSGIFDFVHDDQQSSREDSSNFLMEIEEKVER